MQAASALGAGADRRESPVRQLWPRSPSNSPIIDDHDSSFEKWVLEVLK